MPALIPDTATAPSGFVTYLATNKKMLLIAAGISGICFLLLKYIFPYPDFFEDSTNYLLWALREFTVAYRPTGYAFFLRGLHRVSEDASFTVFVQYLLFFLSSLFCFCSADYLFGLPQKWRWPLLLAILLNPLLLFQTNLISSDTFFSSLTVTWFATCLWIIKKPTWVSLAAQVIMLYLCFETRYTTLFFPFITVAAFLCCTQNWKYKVVGIALSFSVIFFCVQRQTRLNEEQTGTRVFSGFSGWQIANNALHCYKNIKVDNNDLPSDRLQLLDQIVKDCIDTLGFPEGEVSTAYMWDKRSPLKRYCLGTARFTHVDYFTQWFLVSKLYNTYGWYIVQNFPAAYLRWYILPNTKKYFYPDLEAVSNYNSSDMLTPQEAKEWFSLYIDKFVCRAPDLQRAIMPVIRICSLLLNVFIITGFFFFIFRNIRKWRKIPLYTRGLVIVWGLFFFGFMAFSIFATSVNLRFMDPIFVLGLIIPFVLINYIKSSEQQTAA